MERDGKLWKNAEYNSLQTQDHEIEVSAIHCDGVMMTGSHSQLPHYK